MKKRIVIKPGGYIGLILMVLGTFGDDLLNIENQIVDFGMMALVIIGFALAFDGIEKHKKS